jgi:hypothetical protein
VNPSYLAVVCIVLEEFHLCLGSTLCECSNEVFRAIVLVKHSVREF